MKAIRIHQYGGPESLACESMDATPPGADEARVSVRACGINFVDIYQRTGLYKIALPSTLGLECAGVVEEVGENVTTVKRGDRVASCSAPGSYAESVNVPARVLVPLPDSVRFEIGAALMVQGLTAHYLVHTTAEVGPSTTVLVHAAAGGVGLLLIQVAKMRGARVIAVVSTDDKASLAREAGADETICTAQIDFLERAKSLTAGRGVDVVFDSVGKDTFDRSLQALAPLGHLVSFGQASGAVGPFDPLKLGAGSLSLTRPRLADYVATPEMLRARSGDLFRWVAEGTLRVKEPTVYPLQDAAVAHRDLEARRTTGKLVLRPSE
ncbi:MAG: quinone oxidoreductase [Deltaproteobacteria bacterium]|nr:quinone oxidoreductase [Deltaproteobacteria bacterium]